MKKLIKMPVFAAGLLSLLFAFSGCSSLQTDTEALLEPPSLTAEQENLNAALSEVAGTDYTLQYPTSGGASSAFMFEDLDGDGAAEALAFYSTDGESTRINVLKETDGGNWTSVYEAAGLGGSIESVRFANASAESTVLIVKWEQEIGVYRFVEKRLERLYSSNCDGFDVADMTGDGFDDVMLFSGSYVGRSVARVLYEDGGEFVVSAGIDLTAQYSEIVSTVSGELYSGVRGYFIDSQIYSGIYFTEVLTLEENTLVCKNVAQLLKKDDNSLSDEETQSGGSVTVVSDRGNYARNSAVFCHDINGDGIIEIPLEVRSDYAFSGDGGKYFIKFTDYNGTTLSAISFSVADEENGFVFDLPESWEGLVTLSYNDELDEYRISAAGGETVFCIRIYSQSDYLDIYEEAYVLAAKNETKAFFVKASALPESEFYLDPQSCGERFHII